MNTEEIVDYLNTKAANKISQPNKFPSEVKDFLLSLLKNKDADKETITKKENFVSLSFFMYKHNLNSIELCDFEGCDKHRVYTKGVDGWNLRSGCCAEHSQYNTMLKNHGHTNAMFSEKCKNNLNATMLKKYGVDNISKSSKAKEKKKATTLKNYGVEHNSQSPKIKEKKISTTLKNYGVENPQQNSEISKRSAATRLEKYGYSYPLEVEEIRNKAKQTNIIKYGFENAMHNPAIMDKHERSTTRFKTFKWKTGELSKVQGYEPTVLKELEEQGYTFNDVKTRKSDMPAIFYNFENRTRRYYPDFYIPKENRIIEVKSEYTLQKEWEKNQAKFSAVKSHGFDFQLEVR